MIDAVRVPTSILDDLKKRLAAKDATVTREEAIALLAHIQHQDERIEEVAADRDGLRDTLDQFMQSAN